MAYLTAAKLNFFVTFFPNQQKTYQMISWDCCRNDVKGAMRFVFFLGPPSTYSHGLAHTQGDLTGNVGGLYPMVNAGLQRQSGLRRHSHAFGMAAMNAVQTRRKNSGDMCS